MAMDFIGLSVGMGYTDETMLGAGAIKGDKGDKGDSGNTYTPAIGTIRTVDNLTEANVTVDINNNTLKATFNFDIPQGRTGSQGEQGIQGEKGEKGDTYAPVIGDVLTVDSTSEASATVTLDEANKKATFNFSIPKGKDGTNGVDGANGIDGVSPTIEIIPTDTGNTVKITDKDGIKSFDVNNGANGADGANGLDGTNGNDGADGFSPIVTVTEIEGGHNVAIEDKNGVKNFEVLDGADGVQISDNETVEDKTWSSQKTSDEIAKVETELKGNIEEKIGNIDNLKLINLGVNVDADNCRIANININCVYGYCGFFTQNVPMKGYAVIRCYHYGSGIRQFIDYTASTARTYTRFIQYDGKTPTAWKELATKEYVDSKIADLQAQINALK